MEAAQAEDARLRTQKARAYDLVEQGIYSPEIFTQRMAALCAELEAVTAQATALTAEIERLEAAAEAKAALMPNVRRVLELYPELEEPEEKNALLRSVLSKVIYRKTRRERWSGGSDLSLTLIPTTK